MNMVEARLEAEAGAVTVTVDGTSLRLANPPDALAAHAGRTVMFGVRPEDITDPASADGSADALQDFPCTIDVVEPTGSDTFVMTSLGGREITARVRASKHVAPGEAVTLKVNMAKAHFFDPETGTRIG
jgi:multiple sugar transport system ATP-binding protein